MAFDPSDDDISTVIEFTGLSLTREEAAQLLKISNNDVATAVNKVLEAPHGVAELLKQGDTGWDNAAFGGDRYGQMEPGNTDIPSFNIECVDYTNSGGPSTAPTRPPSRTSQHSAISTHMGDAPLQSRSTSAGPAWDIEPLTGWTGVETGQELGLVGNTGTAGTLRPATQAYYDNASWALVPATKSTEYIPDASLSYQKRDDEPGFLKPLLNKDFLPALLTILHSIPLIRNTLLAPTVAASSYWRGEEWWKGSGTTPSTTIDNGSGFDPAPELELLYETQRLIAFLDSSDRSYASLESLLQLDSWKYGDPQEEAAFFDDELLKYLVRWGRAYDNNVPEARLNGVLRSDVDAGGDRENSYVLDATIVPDALPKDPTLYDVLDSTLFQSQMHSAHIVDISSVLIFRLMPSKLGSKANCAIPSTLYADRYVEENRAAVNQLFEAREQYVQALTELDVQVEKIKYHTPQKTKYTKKMETLALLKTSMKAFESDTEAMTESPRDVAVFAQLQALYENIERKLSWLEEEKTKAKAALDEVSERFRAPLNKSEESSDLAEDKHQHKFAYPYKLCGVAVSSSDLFLCRPGTSEDGKTTDQWWHINYFYSTADDSATIERRPTNLEDVIRNVSELSDKALFVYANDAATSATPIPLSAKLRNFIKKDNANFQQEFGHGQAAWEASFTGVAYEDRTDPPTWDTNPQSDEWISPEPFSTQNASALSSATLTPNTDNDDDAVPIELPVEMQEVNGGIAAWAGISNASSETVGVESANLVSDGRMSQASMRAEDIQMVDAEAEPKSTEPRVDHIEVLEKKGG